MKVPLLRRRGRRRRRQGWLFFGNCILITCEDQRTTTPSLRSFPSFAGGELKAFIFFVCDRVQPNYNSFVGVGVDGNVCELTIG